MPLEWMRAKPKEDEGKVMFFFNWLFWPAEIASIMLLKVMSIVFLVMLRSYKVLAEFRLTVWWK